MNAWLRTQWAQNTLILLNSTSEVRSHFFTFSPSVLYLHFICIKYKRKYSQFIFMNFVKFVKWLKRILLRAYTNKNCLQLQKLQKRKHDFLFSQNNYFRFHLIPTPVCTGIQGLHIFVCRNTK